MKTQIKNIMLLAVLTFAVPGSQVFAQQQIYGSQLMTQQERIEHRAKMQSMKTMEERERYRIEHHKKMQERAKQQGVTLPDEPSMPGMGGGRGMGGGPGGGRGR